MNRGIAKLFDTLSTPEADRAFGDLWRELGDLLEVVLPLIGDLAVWCAQKLAPVIRDMTEWLRANKDELKYWAGAIAGIYLAYKSFKIVGSFASTIAAIREGFGFIRSDADKASDAVGRDGKSGLRGRLGALKKIGKIGVTIVAAYVGFELITGLMDGGAGK